MFIRAYLRASTNEQDAARAKNQLIDFVSSHNAKIASFYIENISGSLVERPELNRLISDSSSGDILLVEQIDRLTRLTPEDWDVLKAMINSKNIQIVALDLPTSHLAINGQTVGDEITAAILKAVNKMILDMLAVFAYKDYADRRRRQAEGIKKAKAAGKYKGRKPNTVKHNEIIKLSQSGYSISNIASMLGVSESLVKTVRRNNKEDLSQKDWVGANR